MLVDKPRGDHFSDLQRIYKLSQNSDLQHIQMSIASMVNSTQSIHIIKRNKQVLHNTKEALSASVEML